VQSRIASIIEVTANVGSGFVVAMLIWQYIVPVFYPHLHPTLTENFLMTAVFTGTSVVRGYLWRRFFTNNYYAWVLKLLNRSMITWKTDS
jgi:hypothetical protein